MPIGLAGRAEGARVSLIQLFPSPSPSPAPFGVPTLPTPPQAAGLGWVFGNQSFMLFAMPCITARVAMQSDRASCACW